MDTTLVIASLSALAQPTRLRVFELLAKLGGESITAGEIARLIDTPQNTMSAHLAILSRAGVVLSDKRGREMFYRANLAGLKKLTDHLNGMAGSAK